MGIYFLIFFTDQNLSRSENTDRIKKMTVILLKKSRHPGSLPSFRAKYYFS